MYKKYCKKCERLLPKFDFWKNPQQKDGLRGECARCTRKLRDRPKNPTAPRRKYQNSYRERKFGLSETDVIKIIEEQKNCCKICSKPFEESKFGRKGPMLDHCHKTGRFRGFLCLQCNTGLGSLRDSIPILEEAIKYLKEST